MPAAEITEKHDSLLANGLDLGKPVKDEENFEDGGARQVFEFGTIYFHPDLGAFECHGAIVQAYAEQGEQFGGLGYPITDESDYAPILGARINEFEEGELLFTPDVGVTVHFNVPQVVVKFADSVPIALGAGETLDLQQLADRLGADAGGAIDELADALPDITLRRLFDPLDPGDIEAAVAQAQKVDPSYKAPNFETFLEVLCPLRFDTGRLVEIFSSLSKLVDIAYSVPPTEGAAVVGSSNPRFAEQRYLEPAPVGVGAINAWLRNADGSGRRLVDIEHAWLLNRAENDRHEDLPDGIPLLAGVNSRRSRGHGAGVLGVIAAIDNFVGVVGLAPQTILAVMSPDQINQEPFIPPSEHTAARIIAATTQLGFGDVLLLELQTQGDHMPVETDFSVFKAIQLAVSQGIVVVEAGGNGAIDFDAAPTFFGESGAILVGACESAQPHRRVRGTEGSNFGNRVDCCAWGENVLTTGSRNNPVLRDDYFSFSGTSSAAAIIAGVCLLIQQMNRNATGSPLPPLALKQALRDAANGTLAGSSSSEAIGAMPDLAKIIANLSL